MTIAEVARKFDLTTDTLRYYERIGLIPGVRRTASGIRDFHEEDCRWIEFIKCMRSAGLPVETLIEYVRLFQSGEKTADARKALLVEQRDILEVRILEMQKTLERLNVKIKRYEDVIIPIEDELKHVE
jgi:MerR family transcriptional regulator, aldehyde-responsive regulator